MANKYKQLRSEIASLCAIIYAHQELDMEVTLGGNGTNVSEASNVADEIMETAGISYKEIEQEVKDLVDDLKSEYGIEDEDVD